MNSLDLALPFLVSMFASLCIFTFFEVVHPEYRISKQRPVHFNGAERTFQNILILLVPCCLQFDIPSSTATLWPMMLWYFIAEIWFAFSHRLMHSRQLYRFHKQHHTDTYPPTSADVLNCGIVELFFVNVASILIGPLLIPADYVTICIWIFITCVNATIGHSHFIGPSEEHSLHHARRNVNYGSGMYLLDRLFGTYVDPQDPQIRGAATAELQHHKEAPA